MPAIDDSLFMTRPWPQVLSESFPEFVEGGETSADQSAIEAWQEQVNRLIEWGRRAEQVDEEGFQFPTLPAIRVAFELLRTLRDARKPLPVRIVPTGDGGVSIELVSGPMFAARFDIDEAGVAEFLAFKDCKLLTRHTIASQHD